MSFRPSIIALVAAVLCITTVHAEESTPAAEPFTTLFAMTCMQHYYSQDKLVEQMSSNQVPEVPPQNAEFFLNGKTGKAWVVVEHDDRYVVALSDDGICSVFAQKANAKIVQESFAALVSTAPEPMQAGKRDTDAPNGAETKSVSYAWFRPKDKSELLFLLTTSTSATATVQALASMSLVDRGK